MRNLLWGFLFFGGVLGTVIPGLYFNAASNLPSPFETRQQLFTLVKREVEGERMKRALPLQEKERGFVKWAEPDIGRFPRDFVAAYLSENGCPTFLRAPPEPRSSWVMRVLRSTWDSGMEGGMSGRCAFLFASMLVDHVDVSGRLERALAVHRVRWLLSHEELVAWTMAAAPLDDGLLGLDQGVEQVYRRPLEGMNLAELSEAVLMAPPNNFYLNLLRCQNPPLIKRARDSVLAQMAESGLITTAQSTEAQEAEVACRGRAQRGE